MVLAPVRAGSRALLEIEAIVPSYEQQHNAQALSYRARMLYGFKLGYFRKPNSSRESLINWLLFRFKPSITTPYSTISWRD